MKNRICLCILVATMSLLYPAAAQQEETSAVLNGIHRTVLSNGLTILSKEVHAAPIVYFAVYYKVGSINEQVGQTGMSHLMEHMMFKGTKMRGPGVISSQLQKNGAQFNASTWYDRTEYHETLASDRLELAMQIESDRMVNSVYDEIQHQKEMTVVRSEFEAGENEPGHALSKAVRLAAYQVHPYRWETIGFRSDIENFSRDAMYAYYQNYYAPNNATVVIVGDFDTENALALVRKYFGVLPAHPIQQHFITPEPPQEGERRVVVRRSGTTPQLEIAYHIPGFLNPDQYPISVLESVLSGGRTSRFFLDLVQTGLASDASASHEGTHDPDLMTLDATCQPNHTNLELERALLAEVTTLQKTPITQAELNRALDQAEAGYIFSKESVEDQGSALGEDALRGDWQYSETYLDHLRHVTPQDVERVAQTYLTERNRTVGYFEPITETTSAVSNADIPVQVVTTPTTRSALPTELTATTLPRVPTQENKPTRVVLNNGMTVIVQENHATPTVALSGALLTAGGVFDPIDKLGLDDYTASQLSRGTKSRSLLDIARTLEEDSITVSVDGGDEYAILSGHGLTKDFNTILDLLSDELRNPTFPADEWEKSRAQMLSGLEESRSDTDVLADIAFRDALYPKDHPYYQPTLDEQTKILKFLTRDDLARFHDAYYAPDRLILTIVGDIDTQDAILAVQKYFGDWHPHGNLPPVVIPTVAPHAGPLRTIVIPVPDKAQVDVRFGFPNYIKRTDPEYYTMVVLNTILGGGTGLASLLGVNVRDRLGLVYDIEGGAEATLGAGPFEVAFGANPQNVDAAVLETQRVIGDVRAHGVTSQQVNDAISYLTGSYPVTLSTNGAVASQLLTAQVYGLGLDYIQTRNSKYRAITLEEVNAAAKRLLDPAGSVLVISGTYASTNTGIRSHD